MPEINSKVAVQRYRARHVGGGPSKRSQKQLDRRRNTAARARLNSSGGALIGARGPNVAGSISRNPRTSVTKRLEAAGRVWRLVDRARHMARFSGYFNGVRLVLRIWKKAQTGRPARTASIQSCSCCDLGGANPRQGAKISVYNDIPERGEGLLIGGEVVAWMRPQHNCILMRMRGSDLSRSSPDLVAVTHS